MDRSFALSQVHRVREQTAGIGAKALLKLVGTVKGLEKLDLKTVKELMKQDDESWRAKPTTATSSSSSNTPAPPPPTTPAHAPLSTRALRLLNSSIFLHEKHFLSLLPSLYPPLNTQARSGEIFSQSLRFEVVAFAAGLKSAVLIGWGDGSNPMHAKAASRWSDIVWKEGVMGDFGGELGERMALRDSAVKELRAFLEGCKFMIVGNAVTDRRFVLTGHTLLFHQPASADIRKLLSNPASSSSSSSPIIEESLIASILDYPVGFPSDSPPPNPPNRPIIVTLGEQFRSSTLHGTQYTALQPLHSQLIQAHFQNYKARLSDVLFGVVEICLDGVWAGEAKNEGKRKQYQTDEEAVKRNTEEWVEVMNPDEGIRRLELMRRQGRGEAGGRVLREVMRNGSRDVTRTSTPANNRPTRTNAPQLSTRALKFLSISLYLHESIFLTHLPDYYDLSPSNEHLKTQSHRFEILQFACGLKPAVFLAHTSRPGGPSDPEYSTHVKDKWVGDRWVEQVWRDGLEGDLRAWGAASGGAAGGEEDADVKELEEWVSGCRITVVGDVTTDAGFVLTGYRILYHSLATSQPLIKLLSNSSRPIPSTTTSHIERKQILPEAVFARILDYPVPFPTVPHAQPWEARVTVYLGEGFYQTNPNTNRRTFFGTSGTTYTALEKDKQTPAIRNHLLKYQKKLDGALFGPVSMRWKDEWEEPRKGEARRMEIVEGPLAVQMGWRLWSEGMDKERGFERLVELLKEANGQQVDPKVIRERLMWREQVEASSSAPQLAAHNPFAILDFEEISSEDESEDEEESSLNNITRWADTLHPTSTSSPPTPHEIAQALGTAIELRNSGDEKFKVRKLAEAIVDYGRAIDWTEDSLEDEEFADLLARRAITNLRLWNYQEAHDDCDEALEYDENSLRAYACSCLASMHLEEYERVQDLSLKALAIPASSLSTNDPRLLDLVRRCQTASGHMIEAKKAAIEAEKQAVIDAARKAAEAEREKKAKEEAERRKVVAEEKRKREEAERKAVEVKRVAMENQRKAAEEDKRRLVAEQERKVAEEKRAAAAAAAALAAKSKPPSPPPAPTPPTAAQTKKAKKKKAKKAKKDADSSDDSDGMPPLVSSSKTSSKPNGASSSAKPPPKKPAAAANNDSSDSDDGPPPLVPISKKPAPSTSKSTAASSSKPASKPAPKAPPKKDDSDSDSMPALVPPNASKTKATPPVASKPAASKGKKPVDSDSDSGMPPLVPVNPPQSTKDKAGSKPAPAEATSSKPAPKAKAKEEKDDDAGSDTMPELIPVTSNKANASSNKTKPAAPTPTPQPKPTPPPSATATKKPAASAPPPSKAPLWSGTDSSDSMPELKKAQLPKPPKRKKKVKVTVVVESDSDWGVLVPIPPPPPPQPPKPQPKAAPPAPKPTPASPAPKPTPTPAPKAAPKPAPPSKIESDDDDLPDLIEVDKIPGNASASRKPTAPPPPPAPKAAPAPQPKPAAPKKPTPAPKKKSEPRYVPPSDSDESDSMPDLLPIGAGASSTKPTAPSPPPTSANKKPAPSSSTKAKSAPAPKKKVASDDEDSDAMPALVPIEAPQTKKAAPSVPPPQPKKEAPKPKPAPKAAPPPKKAAMQESDSDSDGPPPLINVGPSGTTVPSPKPAPKKPAATSKAPKATDDYDSDGSLPDLVTVNETGAAQKPTTDPVTGRNIRKEDADDLKAKSFKDQGNAQFNAGKFGEARRLYSEGLKLNPSDDLTLDLLNNRAAAFTKLAQWSNAVADCEKALRVRPTSVKALFRKALGHFNLNQHQNCRESCDLALRANPGTMSSQIRALREKAVDALKK